MIKRLLLIALPALLFAFAPDALAQTVSPLNISVGDDMLSSQRIFQIMILMTVLSLAPSILIMLTSFTRIIIVFSLLRSAMGLQGTPNNTIIISLSLFLTAFIMGPTFEQAYSNGISPYLDEKLTEEQAFHNTMAPFRQFMGSQVREDDLEMFINMMPEKDEPEKAFEGIENVPLQALIPAFMISELRRAFEIGFLIFLPFIVIDLTVASILMSMGMMMLPPVIISLPFKVIFFVLVDGWRLISSSLVQSFG